MLPHPRCYELWFTYALDASLFPLRVAGQCMQLNHYGTKLPIGFGLGPPDKGWLSIFEP